MAAHFEAVESWMQSTQPNDIGSQIDFEGPPRTPPQDPGLPSDPIQYLPYEISTSIIRDALPVDSDYSTRILELTTVSQTWQSVLLSTAVLWSDIYLNVLQPDFLETVAVFVHLSGNAPLKVAIYDHSMEGWAGLLPILLPVRHRITRLVILRTNRDSLDYSDRISRTSSAISNFFDHLGPLPQLQELVLGNHAKPTMSVFESLDLPSTIHLSGTLVLSMPRSARSSATTGRFFDIDKYNSFGLTPVVAPLFRSCTVSLGWFHNTYETTVRMMEEVLSHLKVSNAYIHGRISHSGVSDLLNSNSKLPSITPKSTVDTAPGEYGLEKFIHMIGTSLCHLEIAVGLSQVGDLVNLLRLLARLESLNLEFMVSKTEDTTEVAPGSITVPRMRSLFVVFTNPQNLPILSVAKGLRGLFPVFTHLYPGVESLIIWVNTWPFFASSYMESLRRLKSLSLNIGRAREGYRGDPQYDSENYSVTLHSLEQLGVEGRPLIHRLRTPNLLRLSIQTLESIVDLDLLGISSLRKLIIRPMARGDYTLNTLEYPELRELDLGKDVVIKGASILPLFNLSVIRLKTEYFTNPEGNHLCTELLCAPEGCPVLQELHFEGSLEWDILFLMLERRNFGLNGVKRIHTVNLPFIPSHVYRSLILLLTGEKAVRPPLELVSLEATRELLFDPNVPGCFRCLKSMAPKCREGVLHRIDNAFEPYGFYPRTPDQLYPKHEYRLDALPSDIRDWMGHRVYLVDAWKDSYKGFLQKFLRKERCRRSLRRGAI